MGDLGSTSYVILGMLRLGASTGYEIKRTVDLSTRFFWAASHAQIYPELKRLEEAGLVRGREEPRGGRRRVVYELTPGGEEALGEWLEAGTGLTLELRDLALVKLFFADQLEPASALALVRAMRARHERMGEKLRRSEPPARALAEAGRRFPLATLTFGLEYHDWAIRWCERLEAELGG